MTTMTIEEILQQPLYFIGDAFERMAGVLCTVHEDDSVRMCNYADIDEWVEKDEFLDFVKDYLESLDNDGLDLFCRFMVEAKI